MLSLPVAALGVGFEFAARTTPPINDISTDTEDPPVIWFTATPSDYPAPNAEPQGAAYPEIRPLELLLPFDEAFMMTLALVEARGWELLLADPAEAQIEAIAASALNGFEDEVAIRVTGADTGTRIDMRSRSRLGQIDRGANARRIEAFLGNLEMRARKSRTRWAGWMATSRRVRRTERRTHSRSCGAAYRRSRIEALCARISISTKVKDALASP